MQMSNNKGFSLVEVLVGLLIFSIGALASGSMIVASLHHNQVSKERTIVSSLVSQRLEELRSRPWFDASGGDSLDPGGVVLSNEQLKSFSTGSLEAGFYQTFNQDMSGDYNDASVESFYLVMWQITEANEGGQPYRRILIKGVAMHWHVTQNHWIAGVSFDHVAMIFREEKAG